MLTMKSDAQRAYEKYNENTGAPLWLEVAAVEQERWRYAVSFDSCERGFTIYSPLARVLKPRNGGIVTILRGEVGDEADGVTVHMSGPGVLEMDEVLALYHCMAVAAEMDDVVAAQIELLPLRGAR